MKKNIPISVLKFFVLSFFFINVSFAIELADLATLDRGEIEAAVGDKFGVPDYEQMLDEESAIVEAEESPFVEEAPVTATMSMPQGEIEEQQPVIVSKSDSFSSSAPLAKSGSGSVVGFALALLISSFFAFNRVRI